MNWIDLHADTPLRLYRNHGSLEKNNFHLDVMRSTPFARFLQCAALYCPAGVTDAKGFSFVLSMSDYFEGEIGKCREATLIRSAADFKAAWEAGKRAFLLTLEDARILDGKTERIALLHSRGVRIITPLWRGVSCIGGAHDTAAGLTDFGKRAVEMMVSLRILPDVSHASPQSFSDIREIAKASGLPLIATHSCAAALCPHTRNLTDAQIREIAESGGVVGLNLYPPFLRRRGDADFSDIFRHLRHLYLAGGKELPALGTDFDGVDSLPRGVCGMEDMPRFYTEMKKQGFSEDEADRFFSGNAKRIIKAIL